MATFNQISLIGRIGKDDPELQVTSEAKKITKFSLAVDQGKNQPAMWLQVTCWDKLAETVAEYGRSGQLVFVQEKLQLRKYKDSHHVEKLAVEIIASTVQLLEKRKAEDEGIPDAVLPGA